MVCLGFVVYVSSWETYYSVRFTICSYLGSCTSGGGPVVEVYLRCTLGAGVGAVNKANPMAAAGGQATPNYDGDRHG